MDEGVAGVGSVIPVDFIIRDGLEAMDFERVTQMLARAEWSRGIGQAEVEQGARHSALVVGAFACGVQVGYARAISDRTRFAYVSDVYVDEAFRHNGIAAAMMRHMMAHESLADVYQWLLKSNADELYRKLGFAPVHEPEHWMLIRHPRPER